MLGLCYTLSVFTAYLPRVMLGLCFYRAKLNGSKLQISKKKCLNHISLNRDYATTFRVKVFITL